MRPLCLLVVASVAVCSNDPDPRVITGGGIGDGEIDGTLNVYVIDDDDRPLGGATVRVGDRDQTTDPTGLAVFGDLEARRRSRSRPPGFARRCGSARTART